MRAIYAFGILILIAFLGSRFVFRGKRALSPFNFLFFSGFIYVFLGLYLSRHGLNILSPKVLSGLTPLISLGLGWIGFLFGFQLEYKYLKKFPKKYIKLSLFQFFFILLFISPILLIMLRWLYPSTQMYLLYGLAGSLALLASIHSPTLLNAVSSSLSKRGSYFFLARFLVSVGGFGGIMGLALIASFWHYPFFESEAILKGALVFVISTLIPALMGYFFHLLTKKKTSEPDLQVYLLGMIFFVSGAAFYFNLPPLYVGMVLGIVFSNLTKIHEKIYPLLLSTEKPLYITFLILIGALWEFNLNWYVAFLVFLFITLRAIGNVIPFPFFDKLLRFSSRLPFRFGLCFFSSGGIGIAFAVSLKLAYPLPLTDVFLSVALISIILNEFFGLLVIKHSLWRLDPQA